MPVAPAVGARRGTPTGGCVLGRAQRQHLAQVSGCAARPGQGELERPSGPSGPGCAGRSAQHTLRVPGLVRCVRPCRARDLESCVGNGAEALAASTETLGSYGKGPSESCTKALSVGCVSGLEQRGPLLRERGGRSRIRTQQTDRSPLAITDELCC